MKLNLFLLVVSIFAVLHLCKAGPLRLQKRAAFYIANETACVVDNIVYSNGEPIPTDDPCEACKCRPPGFACVLKECKLKPGCRAVRHAGECCPEYICGCEHNGRMYQDGDEIRDSKNPCYICHCQGSSIACAFVDCIFRDDCDTEFVSGECCPKYTNCTRDVPDRSPVSGGNALPPINLLPALNDESVLPGDLLLPYRTPEPSEEPIYTPQPTENYKETPEPESKESTEISSEPHTAESESLVTEESKQNPEVQEKNSQVEETSNKDKEEDLSEEHKKEDVPEEHKKEDLPTEENEDKNDAEPNDEIHVILNSETDLKKDENEEDTTIKDDPPQTSTDSIKEEEPQTTVTHKIETTETEAEVTEKSPEVESTSTETLQSDQKIKNSASENSKSLKLSDDDQSKDSEVKEVKDDKSGETEKKQEETVPESQSESISEAKPESSEAVDTTESSSTESKPESAENIAEESKTDPQATVFYVNNEKIKSESAETVTIVVHVKDKAKPSSEMPSTEIYSTTHSVTSEAVTSVTQESLLKSSDELENTEVSDQASKVEDAETTGKNFEIFPTSSEVSEIKSTTVYPSTDHDPKEPQGRSDETDTAAPEAEEKPISEEIVPDSKDVEDSPVTTTTQNVIDASEASKEARTNEEVTEEANKSQPTITVIKIDPNDPVKIVIVTATKESSKTEEIKKSEKEETKADETVTENEAEVKEDESEPEEKTTEQNVEDSTQEENLKESTPKEKLQESTQIKDKPEERAEETESQEPVEKTSTENVEITETEESKLEEPTESHSQGTEKPKQTEAPNDTE